jgi:thioester reductase-like protein
VRIVFLTGSTGTIGSALVPRLLAHDDTSLVLLIRAGSDEQLRARSAGMFDHWRMAPEDALRLRIRAVRGDISEPLFGLGDAEFEQVAAQATHVVHCAASVNLNMTRERAAATAVVPTRTMLELVRRGARTGSLRKVDFVSTVGVWGRTPGVMPERRLPEVREFHNTYEAAKAQAEQVIWTEGEGLPITVHRPSMVVGESVSGRVIHFQVFYHLCEFLSGRRTFGIMPDLGQTRLDTVPVDWVANVIDWSSRHDDTAGKIFHLCSGPDGAIALTHLQQRVRQAWQQGGRKLPKLRRVNRDLLRRMVPVLGAVAGAKARRALRALPPILAYLEEEQAFANGATASVLRAAGLQLPAIDTYLDAVLGYYLTAQRDVGRS